MLKYVMEVSRPFRYWTLLLSKRHTVTLHHAITVCNDMFNHMDGVMRASARWKTQWKEDLFFAVKLSQHKLSKYYSEVTPSMGMLLISAHILASFQKLQSCSKPDKGMDINPEGERSYTTQYHEAFLQYGENENCAGHQRVPVNEFQSILSSNLVPSVTAPGSCQSFFEPYDLSSDDQPYVTPNDAAETTTRCSDRTACLLTTDRLYLNSAPKAPKNWGQNDPNLNDYHCQPMEISSTFWLLDITDCWRQQEETHSKCTDVSNVACDIILSYHMVSECRPVFPFGEMLLPGGSQKPHARPSRDKQW